MKAVKIFDINKIQAQEIESQYITTFNNAIDKYEDKLVDSFYTKYERGEGDYHSVTKEHFSNLLKKDIPGKFIPEGTESNLALKVKQQSVPNVSADEEIKNSVLLSTHSLLSNHLQGVTMSDNTLKKHVPEKNQRWQWFKLFVTSGIFWKNIMHGWQKAKKAVVKEKIITPIVNELLDDMKKSVKENTRSFVDTSIIKVKKKIGTLQMSQKNGAKAIKAGSIETEKKVSVNIKSAAEKYGVTEEQANAFVIMQQVKPHFKKNTVLKQSK